MKIISKIHFALISAICAIAVTSCEETSEVLIKLNIVYSSPIAVKDGLDFDWDEIDVLTDYYVHQDWIYWESVVSPESKKYGGEGYAAYYYKHNSSASTMLLSPEIYLEEGVEYIFEFYGKTDYGFEYPTIDVYIYSWDYLQNIANDYLGDIQDYNSEDIYKMFKEVLLINPIKNVTFYDVSYTSRQISFIPKTSGYYSCAFYPTNTAKVYLTGFNVVSKNIDL